jgi:hypothetical protein
MITKPLVPQTSNRTVKLLGQLYLEHAPHSQTTYHNFLSFAMGPKGMGPVLESLMGSINVDCMEISRL